MGRDKTETRVQRSASLKRYIISAAATVELACQVALEMELQARGSCSGKPRSSSFRRVSVRQRFVCLHAVLESSAVSSPRTLSSACVLQQFQVSENARS